MKIERTWGWIAKEFLIGVVYSIIVVAAIHVVSSSIASYILGKL